MILGALLVVAGIVLGVFYYLSTRPEVESRTYLRRYEYDKLRDLYEKNMDQPETVAELNEEFQDHIQQRLQYWDYRKLAEACKAFQTLEPVHQMIEKTIVDYMRTHWDEAYMDVLVFYQKMQQRGVTLDGMDAIMEEYIRSLLAGSVYDHQTAAQYMELLTHNSQRMNAVFETIVGMLESYLLEKDYDSADLLHSTFQQLRAWFDPILLKKAYALQAQEDYEAAQSVLYILRDSQSTFFDSDAQYLLKEVTLRIYLQDAQFMLAKQWVQSFAGETRQKLRLVFLEYSADEKIVADIENAILSGMDLAQTDATPRQQLDAMLAILRKYRNIGCYDEKLQQLAVDYLDALEEQRDALFIDQSGRDFYRYYYQWHLQLAKQYTVLDALHQDYGFGNSDPRLQSLLGIGDGMLHRIQAWYEIHNNLSRDLWDVEPEKENGSLCFTVHNDTAFTFTFTLCQRIYDEKDTLLREEKADAVTLAPGQSVRIVVTDPEGSPYTIDWEIFDIFRQDTPLE